MVKENQMEKYNIIWIYVDSVRRYHSTPEAIAAGDDRSRLEFMDEFGEESIEFLNTVTSAPSTQMSISAMAASIPSYYLANNFSDYFSDNFKTGNLTKLIQDNGYKIYGFLQSKRSREFNLNVFTPIRKKYWPSGFSHTRYWDNTDIYLAVKNALKYKLRKPSFFFINFNCRKDPHISDTVKNTLKVFKDAGYTKDNTITILCSDHGYPDPSKESGRPEYYIERNLSHDLILTDDNIMIPFLLQYPGCPEGMKIETTVSSLDIFPTILDVIKLRNVSEIEGKSLLPLVEKDQDIVPKYESRFFRTDCRLKAQSGKGTVIRNGIWKYVYYHDDTRGGVREEFFNIVEDKLEENNLVNSSDLSIQDTLQIFRNELNRSENESVIIRNKYLIGKALRKTRGIGKIETILLIDETQNDYILPTIDYLSEIGFTGKVKIKSRQSQDYHNEYINPKGIIIEEFNDNIDGRVECVFVLFSSTDYKDTSNILGIPSGKKVVFIDTYIKPPKYTLIAKIRREVLFAYPFLKQEPWYILYLMSEALLGKRRKQKKYK